MQTTPLTDFNALEALKRAINTAGDMPPMSRVKLSHDLAAYLELVLAERVRGHLAGCPVQKTDTAPATEATEAAEATT